MVGWAKVPVAPCPRCCASGIRSHERHLQDHLPRRQLGLRRAAARRRQGGPADADARPRGAGASGARCRSPSAAKIATAFTDAMVADKARVAELLAWQMGRPIRYGPGEVRGFEERARYMIEIAPETLADIDVGPKEGFTRFIRREPLGVVLNLPAWNFPYMTALNAVLPAILAGNTVVMKHSSQTALVAEHFADCFAKGEPAEGRVPGPSHVARGDRQGDPLRASSIRSASPARPRAGAPSWRRSRRRRTFPATCLELGGKDPGLRPPRRQSRLRRGEHRRCRLSSIPASRAAPSSASTSTRTSTTASSRRRSRSSTATSSARRPTRRRRSARWCAPRPPTSCAARWPRRSPGAPSR